MTVFGPLTELHVAARTAVFGFWGFVYFSCFGSFHENHHMPNGAKNWCFTINNYNNQDVERLSVLVDGNASVDYICFGEEVGENGTPHLQGYVQLNARKSLRQLKDFIGTRSHLEVAKGSPQQNREYCSKEDCFREFGELRGGQGRRTDLASALACIKGGGTKRQLIDEHFGAYSRAHRALNEALQIYSQPRTWAPTVRVYYGQTGTGKSRKAFSQAISPYVHSGGSWFDGYEGEADVIFDDFGGSEFKLTYLLKLLDRYPMRVPIKGGFVNWIPKNIWITANYAPRDWFPNAKDEHKKALLRRISETVHFRRLSSLDIVDTEVEEVLIE